jgi:hypothetical protein
MVVKSFLVLLGPIIEIDPVRKDGIMRVSQNG